MRKEGVNMETYDGIKECPNCGEIVSDFLKKCFSCGYKFSLTKECPNCGEILGSLKKNCFVCKYNFMFNRVIKTDDDITAQDILCLIGKTRNSIPETSYGKLYHYLEHDEYDEALIYIQDKFECSEEMSEAVLNLYIEQIFKPQQKSSRIGGKSIPTSITAIRDAPNRE